MAGEWVRFTQRVVRFELKELFVCVIPGKIGWPDLAKI